MAASLAKPYERVVNHNPLLDDFAAARTRRVRRQVRLAAPVGTKQPGIARLEKGETLPSLALLTRVADALGVRLIVRLKAYD